MNRAFYARLSFTKGYKMHIKSLLTAAAFFALVGSAHATVITFEDLSGSASLPSNYAGLTWGDGWNYYDWYQPPYNANSGSERVYNNDGVDTDFFKFSSDVFFDGAYFAGYITAQFELYNDGALVGTSSVLDISDTPTFLASGYSGLVDEVRLNVSNGSFIMDDVTYHTERQSVPEPAILALMGLGLAGLGLSRRKAKSK